MNQKIINERINFLMEKFGVKPYTICKETGIASGNFSDALKGKKNWGMDSLLKIKNYFNVSMDWFFDPTIDVNKKDYTDALVDEMRRKILEQQSVLQITSESKSADGLKPKNINIYNKIAAGNPIETWDNPLYMVNISHPMLSKVKGQLFGFEVKGDSMIPRFRESDIVITKRLFLDDEKPKNRDFVVTFFMDDFGLTQANLKLFNWVKKSKEDFILSSLNTYYEPTIHNIKEVRYMFKIYLTVSPVHYK
jgi:SOS-response transcriptional repressor LexA